MTKRIVDTYELTPQELAELQYYASDDIQLRLQGEVKHSHEVDEGRLLTKRKLRVEDVLIERGTPGVLVKDEASLGLDDPNLQDLMISFEEGSAFLFKSRMKSRYQLKPKRIGTGKQSLIYKGREYKILNPGDDVHLLIERKALEKLKHKKHRVEGRRVDD